MLHEHALHLERTDPVAAGLDDVVIAADEPVISVLIPPGYIAGVVEAVVPGLFRQFRVTVILLEEAERPALVRTDHNLASLARLCGCPVRQYQIDVILRIRHAHAARLRLHPRECPQSHAGLGLAETLHEADTCQFTELLIYGSVERLACSAAISERRKVVF